VAAVINLDTSVMAQNKTSLPVSADSPLAANSNESESDGDFENVPPSFTDYPVHWGRTYHRYSENSYHFPNDEGECERLNLQHRIFNHNFDGRLYWAPLNPEEVREVYDVGTGTGIWCNEIADSNCFPNAKIRGLDLSSIQGDLWPPNVYYYMGDCTDPRDWQRPFGSIDFIHSRFMAGSLESYKSLIKTAKKFLKPGTGWLELHELVSKPLCDDGTMPDDWKFKEWEEKLQEASIHYLDPPRPINSGESLKRWMDMCGYEDVTEMRYKIPLSKWPKDARMKKIGGGMCEIWLEGLPGFTYKLYGSEGLQWTRDEIEIMMVGVRKALMDKSVHAYMMYHVVYGRCPAPSEKPRS
jgi:metalloendopeptidase OMA1, mitochondrial